MDLAWTPSQGLAASDNINGEGDSDQLNGGFGNDTLNGGSGVDTIDGGSDNDLIVIDDGDAIDAVNGGAGTDRLTLTGVVSTGAVINTSAGTYQLNNLLGGVQTLSSIGRSRRDGSW